MSDMSSFLKFRPHSPWWFAPLDSPQSVVRFDDKTSVEAWLADQSGPVQFLPFGPRCEGPNALLAQRDRASAAKQGSWNDRRADVHHSGHDALVAAFADLNGWRVSPNPFALSTLARGGFHDGRELWGRPYDFPGADHVTYFRAGRHSPSGAGRTAAVLVEPYRTYEYEALIDWAAERGLRVYSPPNPKASFWFPGFTYFALILRRADRPRFLRDQLRFKAG